MLRTGPGADQAGLVSLAVPQTISRVKGAGREKQFLTVSGMGKGSTASAVRPGSKRAGTTRLHCCKCAVCLSTRRAGSLSLFLFLMVVWAPLHFLLDELCHSVPEKILLDLEINLLKFTDGFGEVIPLQCLSMPTCR